MYVSLRDRPAAPAPAVAGRVATTVLLLGVVSLLTDVSSEMVAAVLPLYLTAEIGLGLVAYGFVDGVYQGVSALVRIAGGYAGDRIGRPKWVAATGYALSALSRLALLPAQGFAAVTGAVTADRLGKGLRTAPRDALIADASPPAALGRAFGVHRALDTTGAVLGPLVAFAVLAGVPGSYDSVFVVSFAFAVAGVAVLVLLVPGRRAGRAGSVAATDRMPLPRSATVKALGRPLLAAGLLGALTVGDGFLYLSMLRRDGLPAQYFPLLYVGTNLAYLALAIPCGRLADRLGRARVFLAGHLALLAAYLLAAVPWGGAGWTLACLVLLGAFYAATDGVLAALVSRAAPARSRGTALASVQTVVAVTRFASSVGFGALWAVSGRVPALVLVGAGLAAALPLAYRLLRPAEPGPTEPADPAGAAT